MSLTINHNLMAMNSARNLDAHYGALSVSTRRLSSGLRIGTSADDAAGLAIRELMRSEVKSLYQGIRNANDAISMVQTADGALQVIDEKLIRMKELAMQASTGTYNSDQRLIIDSEFQAMKFEIYRIAQATDFNGIHLLDGTLSGSHDGSELQSTGAMKVHFGTGNDAAEDYYYIDVPQVQDETVNLGGEIENQQTWGHLANSVSAQVLDAQAVSEDAENVEVFYKVSAPRQFPATETAQLFLRASGSLPYDFDNFEIAFDRSSLSWSMVNGVPGSTVTAGANVGEVWVNLPSGGRVSGIYNLGYPTGDTTVQFDLSSGYGLNNFSTEYPNASISNVSGGVVDVVLDGGTDADIQVTFAGSPNNGYAQLDLKSNYELREGALGLYGMDVRTQANAQQTLVDINDAIVAKDKIRASLGATQNRFENTISNLEIQAENLQASESRISDVDVAQEMTEFVRRQILTQSAVAMLAQANSLPRMALQLLSG